MSPSTLTVGSLKIHGLRDGFFYLDGGAMFGVVPKVLWQKLLPADAENRIKLGLNSLLVEAGDMRILVETGIGADLRPKLAAYYSLERNPGLVPSLKDLGCEPDMIDYVINTHLHFDHCGGNTYKNADGEVLPTFPNAKYAIQKCEWENGTNPSARDKPSYISSTFLPLQTAGQLWLLEGETEIAPGIEVVMATGHTDCHQCVKISSEGQTVFFLGDMIPTSAHVGLPYIMSYDLYPMQTLQNKEHYLEQAIQEDWIVAFNHDPEHYFGKIVKVNDKYRFQPLSADI
jgi:glyoxylase-like metal-dependent hydrolase (beta-lactamase superfamily II)